ncbi:MAG: NAD-dependent succinate-semialdehyde dehydrogenase [Candidatus Eremiobacteraeota bacterium]|nr:NAD-dependent succinate-semialdehyde dehydrogenase [Candidatus Eremiobacteraeota bacterium]
MAYASTNPATGEVVAQFDSINNATLDLLIERANDAFQSWKDRPIAERAAVVGRAGELMRERSEEFAKLITLEMGKLINEARGEVKLASAILRYYGKNGGEFLKPKPLQVPGGEASLVYAPLGALIGIEPWNFPLYQVVRFAAPNLVVGNTILLKHASINPQCALALEQVFLDAGAPEGVYTNVFIESDQVAHAIEHELVRGASLTGSDAAGRSVGEVAGRNTKKVVLELGGSDAFIVLDGENLERTIKAAVMGRMANTGQSCVASKRFIILESCFDAIRDGMKTAFEQLKPGDPTDESTTLGPLSSANAVKGLVEQIDDAVMKGATLITGGHKIDRRGNFLEATILTDVKPGMRAFHEELFGPVAVLYKVKDEDEAIALANDSPYGLGGSVFASDVERARRVADRVETGMVWINHPTSSLPNLPFGGIKQSGFGRELSDVGIHEFVNQKLICTLPPDGQLMGAGG